MNIADLVYIPPVRTVIRLADLQKESLRRGLVESFIATGEAAFTLSNILKQIEKNKPQGFFVIGNYGSGKSHLLNVLSLLLSDSKARKIFQQIPSHGQEDGLLIPDMAEKAARTNLLLLEISLVEYSNREYLEEIILAQAGKKLPQCTLKGMPRQEAFRSLQEALRKGGFNGLLILIDELSEFLRSKDNPRTYNEDIRFLQYLGESAEFIPAWIVATMQENIENTGALSGEMLHKIKDRYPVRFRLTGEHVKEIVSRRLVQKKDAAADALPSLYKELLRSFGRLPFSRKDFEELYPVHPQTVELLDELRPLFSQHRGVVDFIHYRLAGDERRGIEPFLFQPADHLLTADHIFDHFRDRIRETVETSPYSEEVYYYFQREAASIFPDEEDARTALRLIKLLILEALVTTRKPFTAAELTGLLLHRYTELDSSVNYDYIEEILQKLTSQGAYIVVGEKSNESAEKTYAIDLQADAALLVKKKLKQITSSFQAGDFRVVEGLLPWLNESYLPLNQLHENTLQETEVTWQNTRRQGKIIFNTIDYLTTQRRQELQEELKSNEIDFIFFMAQPFFRTADHNDENHSFSQVIKKLPPNLVLWLPRAIYVNEEEKLLQAYAYAHLYRDYSSDDSPTGKQIREQIQTALEDQRRKVKEIFRNVYFQGTLQTARKTLEPSALGYLHFNDLVSTAASEGLKLVYHRHFEICPQSEQMSRSLIQRTLDTLASPDSSDESLERGTRAVIESHLRPLGVVKKRGNSFVLEFSPRSSPLIAEFLSHIPAQGRVSLQELYWKLRKGPFGLTGESFQALGLSAILSGAVSAYQGGKRISPAQVNYYRFWKVEEVGTGTIVRPELQDVLMEIPFLPARLQTIPLTFSAQQAVWEHVTAFKEEMELKNETIRAELKRLEGNRFLPALNLEKIERILHRFAGFLAEIKVSYASQEGLERFLAAYQSNPLVAEDLARLEALHTFFREDLRDFLRLGYYLHDPGLKIPQGEKYKSLHQHHRVLVELLAEEELAWDKKLRERINREFKLFLDEYISLYLDEHNRYVGSDALQPYRTLAQSPAYGILERFGQIGALSVPDDIVSINRQLSSILAKECRLAEESLLRERPLCSCGFQLGQTPYLPLATELEAHIHKGVRNYLKAIQGEKNKEKILRYADNLEMIGRRREASSLRKLVETSPQKEELIKYLSSLLDRNTCAHLHKAIFGEAFIAKRSLDHLQELLADRIFTAKQLEETFFTWVMGKEGKKPDYIRISGGKEQGETFECLNKSPGLENTQENTSKAREALLEQGKLLLEERYPTLLPLFFEIGEKTFLSCAILLGWLNMQDTPGQDAPGTQGDSEPGDELESLLFTTFKTRFQDLSSHVNELSNLGKALLMQEENSLSPDNLQKLIQLLESKLSGSELLELHYSYMHGSSKNEVEKSFQFYHLLEQFVQEPLFPSVAVELYKKIARQIAAEENQANIKVLQSSLSRAQKELEKRCAAPGKMEPTAKKRALLNYLVLLIDCSLSLRTAELLAQAPPEKDKDWENIYRQISSFELQAAQLEQAPAEAASVLPIERWKRRFTSAGDLLGEKFEAALKFGDHRKRYTLEKLLYHFSGWVEKYKKTGGVYLFILDGLRFDIWRCILEKIIVETKFKLVKEGFTWANLPTVTETQLEPLKEKWLLGHIINMSEEAFLELLSDPLSFYKAVDNSKRSANKFKGIKEPLPLKAVKLNYIDSKVHTSIDDPLTLMEEILLQSRKKLWPLLDNAPADSLILILSDHGFRTNPYFHRAGKADEPRYLHGESTPFEVLAPWTLLQKP